MKSAVIIATYNRQADLLVCIRSILQQTRMPDELIVVDDGNMQRIPEQKLCEDAGINCIYHQKKTPGLTASRNAGVALTEADVVFFFDDDVELMPDYVDQIMAVYEQSDVDLGGVGGAIIKTKTWTTVKKMRRYFDWFFMVNGFTGGKVLPSGFCVDFETELSPRVVVGQVDFLAGCSFSFHRRVFQYFSFDENYQGYGLGVVKDFSVRVATKFRLLINPLAQLYHHQSPEMRYQKERLGMAFVQNRYVFFVDHVCRGWWSYFFFFYALTGYVLARAMIAFLSLDWSEFLRVKGIMRGVWSVLRQMATGSWSRK